MTSFVPLNRFQNDLQQAKAHLAYMMWQEKPSGEFLLASVVEDSLLYNFSQHAESEDLLIIAEAAAAMAVQTAAKVIRLHEFTVTETVRGVMHSMVRLGGDPHALTGVIVKGALHGIKTLGVEGGPDKYLPAVLNGIRHAKMDMGLTEVH
ncbi:MAG: hypothetical protein K6T83_07225 [Alicyclobacillus sp.]|nr:hypothetical protein [Alicyclobacillus sp.]